MKRTLPIYILALFLSVAAYAQRPAKKPEPCATMEQDSLSRIRFPQRGSLDDFEYAVQKRIHELEILQQSGRTQATVITIPVVVHVIHNGENVGSGTNISQAQVQSQIAVLNEDYRRKIGTPGYNTSPVGADIEIEFCLAPVDENGVAMAEPGIDRVNGGQADWSRDQIENQLKPSTYWNPNLFFNIWTVKFATSDANLLGYAQFPDQSGLAGIPSSGPATTDGVVIRYQSFGSADKGTFPVMQAPYNKGRTLTHETGHWLGLRHIWGDAVCGDDFVSDTPPAHTFNNGCPSKVGCDNVTLEMVQNYMDYTNDACMNIFTQGQKTRMRAVMDVSPRRKTLIEANLCSPIVAEKPTANFTSDKQFVLLGGDVNFTDLSTNFPTQWSWTFEGGDPNTSTERNPRVTYTLPGTYKVTLVATNSLGDSDPLVIDNYITVSEEGLCGSATNFDASYTRSAIKMSTLGNYTGYLTGHNSTKSTGVSEFFVNSLGYYYISGVKIRFAKIYAADEDATATVTVWNARGPQNAPAAVLERKTILLKQIQEDIAHNRPTTIVFDRETPVKSRPYQVGVEFEYTSGDTVVVTSSANGEALNSTSWIQAQSGTWSLFSTSLGANIAMDIEPLVGMNPSVQVSASSQMVYPGEEVTLNGHGASIFVWSADDGTVKNIPGPQLIVTPTKTTTYLTIGSGLDLCYDSTYTTIYIRQDILGTETQDATKGITVYPNPGRSSLNIRIENNYTGNVEVNLQSSVGLQVASPLQVEKHERTIEIPLETAALRSGVYLVQVKLGGRMVSQKWIKLE
ncbi:MAG TPA: M43 family zinc metalloprotease [Ohtaekwangia sp.]